MTARESPLSPPNRRIPGRLWTASMVLIGLLLAFYREREGEGP